MKTYNRAERLNHLVAWQNLNISGQAYCKEHNIKPTTFYGWIKAEKNRKETEQTKYREQQLVPVPTSTYRARSETIRLEMHSVIIHVSPGTSVNHLQTVLQALEAINVS